MDISITPPLVQLAGAAVLGEAASALAGFIRLCPGIPPPEKAARLADLMQRTSDEQAEDAFNRFIDDDPIIYLFGKAWGRKRYVPYQADVPPHALAAARLLWVGVELGKEAMSLLCRAASEGHRSPERWRAFEKEIKALRPQPFPNPETVLRPLLQRAFFRVAESLAYAQANLNEAAYLKEHPGYRQFYGQVLEVLLEQAYEMERGERVTVDPHLSQAVQAKSSDWRQVTSMCRDAARGLYASFVDASQVSPAETAVLIAVRNDSYPLADEEIADLPNLVRKEEVGRCQDAIHQLLSTLIPLHTFSAGALAARCAG